MSQMKNDMNEVYDSVIDEADKQKNKSKDAIIAGLKGMRPGYAMQAIAGVMGQSTPGFFVKHIGKILFNSVKSGAIKAADLTKSIKDFSNKNVEDNSGIDWNNIQIDPHGMSAKCIFDGDSKKIVEQFMKTFESSMKGIDQEIKQADDKLHKEVKQAGVKLDNKTVDKNGIVVATAIDDAKKSGKSGKELTNEITAQIKVADQLKEIKKKSATAEKTLSNIKIDKKLSKMSNDELDKLAKSADGKSSNASVLDKIQKKLISKIGQKFAKTFVVNIYDKDTIIGAARKSRLKHLDFSSIKSDKLVCARISFLRDEAKQVMAETDDSSSKSANKPGYRLRTITQKEKKPSVKRIYDLFIKTISDELGDRIDGNAVGYLKYWKGSNDDGNLDTLFVFIGIKNNQLNENDDSYTADTASDATDTVSDVNDEMTDANSTLKTLVNSINNQGFTSSNSLKKLVKTTTLLGGDDHDKLDYHKYDKMLRLFAANDSHRSKDIAEKTITKALTRFIKTCQDGDSDKAVKQLLSIAKNVEQKDVLAELGYALRQDSYYSFKDAGIEPNFMIDKIGNTTYLDNHEGGYIGSSNGTSKWIAGAGMEGFTDKNHVWQAVPKFEYDSLSKEIDDLNEVFTDGEISDDEMEKMSGIGAKLFNYSKWASENADSDDPAIKAKIALIVKMNDQYKSILDNNHIGYSTDSAARIMGLDPTDPSTKGTVSVAMSACDELDSDAASDTAGDAADSAGYAGEEAKSAGLFSQLQTKLGIEGAVTALGVARLVCKTSGIVLNHGKDLVNMFGAQSIKRKEDANIIAELRCIISNGENSESNLNDTKFSVRLDANDCKWHATCLDNRKMKFPEDKLIDAVFSTEYGKKFKQHCMSIWNSIFCPDGSRADLIPFIIKNAEKLGLSKGKISKSFINTIQLMSDKYDEIQVVMK